MKKEWKDALDDAAADGGPEAVAMVQKVHDRIAAAEPTEAARSQAAWDQFKKNGDAMLAEGGTVDDLLKGAAHALKHAETLKHSVKHGL